MTVLITGGAGYIGSHMVHAMHAAGERTVVLDNLSTGFASSLPEGTELVVGDIDDQRLLSSLIAAHKVEAIIHFAASVSVAESVVEPLAYYRNNVIGSRTLIECAVSAGVPHFIFSSSAAVYGNPQSVPVSENAPAVPVSPYGWSKLMAEVMLRDAALAHGLRYVILRYFNVAGADPQGRTGQSTRNATHLIKIAVETALGLRPKMEIFGTDYPTPDGTCVRDYVHVTDLVAAHMDALGYLRQGGTSSTLNCGYGRGSSVLEVVEAVKQVSGIDFRVERGSRRPGDPSRLVADGHLIRAVLDWQPRYDDLRTIVSHALAWERKRSGNA
jgi:UDP-glucose 4-epimerase